MVPKTWPWYATSPSIWSAKSLTSDRSSAAESAPPGTRNTCWKSSARCGRNLVNLDSLPCSAASFVQTDDIEAFVRTQKGLRCLAPEWVDISRGLGAEEPDRELNATRGSAMHEMVVRG